MKMKTSSFFLTEKRISVTSRSFFVIKVNKDLVYNLVNNQKVLSMHMVFLIFYQIFT